MCISHPDLDPEVGISRSFKSWGTGLGIVGKCLQSYHLDVRERKIVNSKLVSFYYIPKCKPY